MSEIETRNAVIISAGFGGLYAIKRVLDTGFSLQAFDAGDSIGGTWVLLRDPLGRFDPQTLLCTDPASEPLQILA